MSLKDVVSRLIGFLDPSRNAEVVIASAPGRADFLNTHQDYKGLPVVPIAIELRCYAAGYRSRDGILRVSSVNLFDEGVDYLDEVDICSLKLRGGGWFGDYARALVKVFMDMGVGIDGLHIAILSHVPIGSGLSSSAALEVSIAKLIAGLYDLQLSRRDVAEIAYTAEHDVIGIPCGRLDQYGSSYGGILKLDTRPPYDVEELPDRGFIMVLADSGVRRRIVSVHPVRQAEIDEALRILLDEVKVPVELALKLGRRYYEPRWEDISEEEIEPYLSSLPSKLANRVIFTIRMHRSTMYALSIIKYMKAQPELYRSIVGDEFSSEYRPNFDDPISVLGCILSFQHTLLRDLYEVSLPRLEEIWSTMLDSGALGAKISGAGLGGVILGLARSFDEAIRIRKACLDIGCPSAWVSKIGEGARVDLRTYV
ncbi:MAG: galactokinase family protein [Candidatus Bathyarchaeia archaeon]